MPAFDNPSGYQGNARFAWKSGAVLQYLATCNIQCGPRGYEDSMEQIPIDVEKLPPDLRALARQVTNPAHGFFGPESLSWRIGGEMVLLFGGYRALLLQLAHPHVAQGVSEHSNFQQDPIGRALRTFGTVGKILYGTRDEALRAALRTRTVHGTVKGKLPEATGEFAAQSHYHANRGDLLFWVYATLIDSAIHVHEVLGEPLSESEKVGYYEESKTFVALFGAPMASIPETYADFRAAFDGMVEQKLAVSPAGRALCTALFNHTFLARASAPLNQLLTAGMLPPRIREAYGLPWNPARELLFKAAVRTVRLGRFATPMPLRYTPYYHLAMRRVRKAGKSAKGGQWSASPAHSR
jgi:uncharacterized protein (DUF2236 family)